jgi:hypothetical protein
MNLEKFKRKVICLIQEIIVTTVQEVSLPRLNRVTLVKFLHFGINLFISQKILE